METNKSEIELYPMTPSQIRQRKNAGALGGQAILERYGVEWLQKIGKLGGRPRLANIELLRQQKALKAANKENQIGGMDSRRSENLGQLKRLIRLKYFGAKCELRPRKGNEAMPQQQVTYRIKNERTGQWWEGKADSPIDAMRKASLEYPVKSPKSGGWTAENCWVRQWCSAGYGSWVTQTMSAKTTEMVKA